LPRLLALFKHVPLARFQHPPELSQLLVEELPEGGGLGYTSIHFPVPKRGDLPTIVQASAGDKSLSSPVLAGLFNLVSVRRRRISVW
jgi:hypothetical protein